MIIVIRKNADQSQVENLLTLLKSQHIEPNVSIGAHQTVIGCVGDVSHLDSGLIEALDVVNPLSRDLGSPHPLRMAQTFVLQLLHLGYDMRLLGMGRGDPNSH